jgi:hypothetical protein
VTPNSNLVYFAEIIRRAERLDEWTDFEERVCMLRAHLDRFQAPHQHLFVGVGEGQEYREPAFRGMVRANWEALHAEHRTFLETFPDGFTHIGKTLDGGEHAAVVWVRELRERAQQTETAIVIASSIPKMQHGCSLLQASVINCLKQYGKTVKREIAELLEYVRKIPGPAANGPVLAAHPLSQGGPP